MNYDPEDVTTYRFRRVSAVGVAASLLLHATAAVALLAGPVPPRQEQITEQAIELTLERPTAPFEVPALAGVQQAALR